MSNRRSKSLRKTVLHLIASGLCRDKTQLKTFYKETFWWHQTLEHNPKKLEGVEPKIVDAVKWLSNKQLLVERNNELYPTRLGTAVASTGLLPSTGVYLLEVVLKYIPKAQQGKYLLPLIHTIVASDEFGEKVGQRFLPYARYNQPEQAAWDALKSLNSFIDPNGVADVDRVTNAAYGIQLWANGTNESLLRRTLPSISYGQFHILAADVSWVLDGLVRILRCPDSKVDPGLVSELEILSDRVRYGVPAELVDIVKAAQNVQVPGFGRQRAMALFQSGLSEPNILVTTKHDQIRKAVESSDRAHALISAVSEYFSLALSTWKNRHIRRTKEIDGDVDLIAKSYDSVGEAYEDAVEALLSTLGWNIKKLDEGGRQGVPDLLVKHEGRVVLIECKTKKNAHATIDKQDAFAVLTKGVDIKADHLVTVGKPDFDTFSKAKAAGSPGITLISHHCLTEVVLRNWEGHICSNAVFEWINRPGVASPDTE